MDSEGTDFTINGDLNHLVGVDIITLGDTTHGDTILGDGAAVIMATEMVMVLPMDGADITHLTTIHHLEEDIDIYTAEDITTT